MGIRPESWCLQVTLAMDARNCSCHYSLLMLLKGFVFDMFSWATLRMVHRRQKFALPHFAAALGPIAKQMNVYSVCLGHRRSICSREHFILQCGRWARQQ